MKSALLLWSHLSLLLVLILASADLTASRSSCPSHCGNISIPYPFGIGKGCYLNEWFAIQCNNFTSGDRVPYLPKINKEVVNISLPEPTISDVDHYGSLRIKTNITSMGCSNTSDEIKFGEEFYWLPVYRWPQYVILQLRWAIQKTNLSFTNSLGCGRSELSHYIDGINHCGCSNTDDESSNVGCACNYGYTDIDECQLDKDDIKYCEQEGGTCVNTPGDYQCVVKKNKTVLITIVRFSNFWLVVFQDYVSVLLTSTEGSIEKTKVFTSKELEKATENFNSTRVLGQGGQGTVYKGMLVDGRIVAVKKSTVVDEDKLEEFINEVVILSQINHRNIVKLIGCCLETEVPLLVYEFISNGNLFEHLHGEIDESTMTTWAMRLRIIIDIAGALSYLHSAAASPIFHRDVKSTNIMLDEKYRAKVSDFGTSRTVTVDHTHLTTVVSGTVGYVDPEYFQSSQFTDKSDVYSFGVVLVELITGEKPISFVRFQKSRTLATYFIIAMEENRVVDIIDPQIRDDCNLEQVMAAAQLARRCLNLNGRNRPSMREVSMELERIRSPNGDSQSHVHIVGNNAEEVDAEINIGVESCNNVGVTAPSGFQYNIDTTSWLDAEPLFPRQTW
ncbi:hypothetical protein Bca101_052537 [Brassica carinata]